MTRQYRAGVVAQQQITGLAEVRPWSQPPVFPQMRKPGSRFNVTVALSKEKAKLYVSRKLIQRKVMQGSKNLYRPTFSESDQGTVEM